MAAEDNLNSSQFPACPECGEVGAPAAGYGKAYEHAGPLPSDCHTYLWSKSGGSIARDVRSHGERAEAAANVRPLREIFRRR